MVSKRIPWEKAQVFLAEGSPAPQDRPAQEAALRLLRLAVRQELTPRQRQCVELYYFRGMTMEETGKALGIGKATVCRHLQKSKKRLGRALSYGGLNTAPR